MKKKTWLLGGVLAPVVYLVTVVVGGVLRPGYDPYAEAISELVASGAPNKAFLDPAFIVYNLLALAFAVGVLAYVAARPSGRRSLGLLASGFLIFGAVVGLATVFFPQDPGGPAVTSTGAIHIVLAGLSSLASMLSMLCLGLWQHAAKRRALARYSFGSLLLVAISGGLAAASVAIGLGASGLLERITIFGYLQWMFVIAVWLAKHPVSRPKGTDS